MVWDKENEQTLEPYFGKIKRFENPHRKTHREADSGKNTEPSSGKIVMIAIRKRGRAASRGEILPDFWYYANVPKKQKPQRSKKHQKRKTQKRKTQITYF